MPVSFWLNGVVLNIVLSVAILAVPWTDLTPQAPRPAAVGIALLWVLGGAIAVWQLVGIWRATNKHVTRGNSPAWAALTKLVAGIIFLKVAFDFINLGVPQIAFFTKIAIGDDPVGTYELRVVNGKDELEIDGAIVFGLHNAVEKALIANPSIRTIRLNSKGGRISEAKQLRKLIDRRGLRTSTTSSCLSACTFPYIAGKERLIARGARLGFHRYEYPGMEGRDLRLQYEQDKQDWLARGLAKAMVDRAFETPHDEMWVPTERELFESRVVTGYLD